METQHRKKITPKRKNNKTNKLLLLLALIGLYFAANMFFESDSLDFIFLALCIWANKDL